MSGLIRDPLTPRLAAFSFADVEAQAAEIEQAAQSRAAEIVNLARKQAEQHAVQARAAAHAAGEQAGYAAGLQKARRDAAESALNEARVELDQLRSALSAALTDFATAKRRLLAEAESGLIALALAVARRVCKTAVGAASDIALANARHLIDLARAEADLVLHVHPQELEAIRDRLPQLLRDVECSQHVDLTADPEIARGGCILKGRHGLIDAQINTQLDRLAAVLLGAETPDPAAGSAAP